MVRDLHAGKMLRPLEDTLNWQFWKERKQSAAEKDRWTDEQIRIHLKRRFDLVLDLMNNGQREPILVWADGRGIDGGNRAQILHSLGHKSIIVRTI